MYICYFRTATESKSEPHPSLARRDGGYETPPDTLPSPLSSGARDYVRRPREMDAAAIAEDEPALHSEGNNVLPIFLNFISSLSSVFPLLLIPCLSYQYLCSERGLLKGGHLQDSHQQPGPRWAARTACGKPPRPAVHAAPPADGGPAAWDLPWSLPSTACQELLKYIPKRFSRTL